MKLFGWGRRKDAVATQEESADGPEMETSQIDDVASEEGHDLPGQRRVDTPEEEPLGDRSPGLSSDAKASESEGGSTDGAELSDAVDQGSAAEPAPASDSASSEVPETAPASSTTLTASSIAAVDEGSGQIDEPPVDTYAPEPFVERPERERAHLRPRRSRRLSPRQERRLAKDKTEPCDAAELFLQSSESRLREATMALAECRVGLHVAERAVERVTDRFEEELRETASLREISEIGRAHV